MINEFKYLINRSTDGGDGGGNPQPIPTEVEGVFLKDNQYVNYKGENLYSKQINEYGWKLDKDGNAIGDDNTIAHKREEVLAYLTGQKKYEKPAGGDGGNGGEGGEGATKLTIEFKDGKYLDSEGNDALSKVYDEADLSKVKIAPNGDVLGEDGTVIKTKDELLKELEEYVNDDDSDDSDYISQIEAKTNIQLLDKDNKPIVFENSLEGLAQRELAIAAHFEETGKTKAINEYLSMNPHIVAAANHYKKHGTFSGAVDKDYSTIQLDKNNLEQLKNIISDAQYKQNTNPNKIQVKKVVDAYINAIAAEGDDVLYNEAVESQNYLKELQAEEVRLEAERVQSEQLAKEAKIKANVMKTAQIVKSGKLVIGDKVINIPKQIRVSVDGKQEYKSIDEFIKFFSVPAYKDDKGREYTEWEKRALEKPFENQMQQALIDFAGGIDQFVVNAMNSQSLDNILKIKQGKKKPLLKPNADKGSKGRSNIKL